MIRGFLLAHLQPQLFVEARGESRQRQAIRTDINCMLPVRLPTRQYIIPAVMRVDNDMIVIVDKGHIDVLTLLDLSTASDTVNRSTLQEVIRRRFRIRDRPLDWVVDYRSSCPDSQEQVWRHCPAFTLFHNEQYSALRS